MNSIALGQVFSEQTFPFLVEILGASFAWGLHVISHYYKKKHILVYIDSFKFANIVKYVNFSLSRSLSLSLSPKPKDILLINLMCYDFWECFFPLAKNILIFTYRMAFFPSFTEKSPAWGFSVHITQMHYHLKANGTSRERKHPSSRLKRTEKLR